MKILVVDDSSTMRRIIKNALASIEQQDIVDAGDGMEALKALEDNPDVGLVLLDWNMPNMNGLEFLKRVRANTKDLPVVMVTTEGQKKSVLEAVKAGVNNYVVKPFTPEMLLEKLGDYFQ